ncbi:MAG TPA: bifunctional 5,10-methylenetetrahydrofolate dehydrogenase/5,10-methenyltetrahydrofolate cyclohydrolase [Bacillota bacterium]|nr:bifunctional 5,10-methylenetetrahydrofolate dehydrogenase/5,10-methenyltetrahydrofolate cyclohydrolase [Bacillota bacterium]
MTRLLSGDAIAAELRKSVKGKAEELAAFSNLAKLAVVFVGDDPTSRAYAHAKVKMGSDLFTNVDLHESSSQTSANSLLKLIRRLNNDEDIDGIFVELPLPNHFNEAEIVDAISYEKDVSGLHPYNLGKLLNGDESLGIAPVVPQACLKLLSQATEAKGRRTVIVGRSKTAARPLTAMMVNRGALVTLVDPEDERLPSLCREAEIVIAAAQVPGLIKPDMVDEHTIVIDAGLNQHQGELVGDADFAGLKESVQAISPVPGGVDRLTSLLLFNNLIKVAERRRS